MALPNTLANIMPKILARGLMTLRERAMMPRLVNLDYSTSAAQKGSTIDVPIPSAIAAVAVSPGATPVDATALTPKSVAIALDTWMKSTPFGLTDKELVELDENQHFVPMQVDEAVRGLANKVNTDVMATISQVNNATHTSLVADSSTAFDSLPYVTDVRKRLNQTNAPRDNRRMVVNFDSETALLNLGDFMKANEVGAAGGAPRVTGEIGTRFGFDIYADDALPAAHTGLVLTGSTPVTNGADVIGETSIAMNGFATDGSAGNKDPRAGDVFSIAHGGTVGTRTYQVQTVTGAADGGAFTVTVAEPGLAAAVENDTAVTFLGAYTKAGVAFHRDAFALATRPLLSETSMYDGMNSNMMSMTDPQTGLSLRLEVTRQYKQVVWEFDILYGVKCVRPELACLCLG